MEFCKFELTAQVVNARELLVRTSRDEQQMFRGMQTDGKEL